MKREDVSQTIRDLAGERGPSVSSAKREERLDRLTQDYTNSEDSEDSGNFAEIDDDMPIDAVAGRESKPDKPNKPAKSNDQTKGEQSSDNQNQTQRNTQQDASSRKMREASEQISEGIKGVSSSLVDRGRSLVDQKIDSFRNTLLQDESNVEVPKFDLKNEDKVEATKSVIEVILFVLEKVLLLPVYVFGKYLGLFMSKEFEGNKSKVLLISIIFSVALVIWEIYKSTYDFWKLIFPIMADLIVIIL